MIFSFVVETAHQWVGWEVTTDGGAAPTTLNRSISTGGGGTHLPHPRRPITPLDNYAVFVRLNPARASVINALNPTLNASFKQLESSTNISCTFAATTSNAGGLRVLLTLPLPMPEVGLEGLAEEAFLRQFRSGLWRAVKLPFEKNPSAIYYSCKITLNTCSVS